MKENAIPKGTKDAAKSEVILFEGKSLMKILLIVIKTPCKLHVVDLDDLK